MKSLLDNDLYKFLMSYAIMTLYGTHVTAEYRFINRGKHVFPPGFGEWLKKEIHEFRSLSMQQTDRFWMMNTFPYFKDWYIDWLFSMGGTIFDPNDVKIEQYDGSLDISVKGAWHRTMFWEIPLLYTISDLWYTRVDKKWMDAGPVLEGPEPSTKARRLDTQSCNFVEFGTRRRRSYGVQKQVLKELCKVSSFKGTSNLHFAKEMSLKPVGTMAHEWVQGIAILESINHPNRYMMRKWHEVFKGALNCALSDTFSSQSFFRDYGLEEATLFPWTRQDSGSPIIYANDAISHYRRMGIDPMSKGVCFSDCLTVNKALEINRSVREAIQCLFGIGTHFTNDFKDSPPLNIVIKLNKINGQPIIKLSDDPAKNSMGAGDHKLFDMLERLHK